MKKQISELTEALTGIVFTHTSYSLLPNDHGGKNVYPFFSSRNSCL